MLQNENPEPGGDELSAPACTELETAPLDRCRLFDLRAAVAYLRSIGASSATMNFIRGIVASGEVPHVRVGKKYLVLRSSLDRWIETHQRRGTQ